MTVHILGLGSIGILSAHFIRTSFPLLPICYLARPTAVPPSSYTIHHPDGQTSLLSGLLNDTNDTSSIQTLLVTTKAHQTRTAIQPYLARITNSTLLIFLQNGMGVLESLGDVPPSERIIQGTTTGGVHRNADVINWVARGETVFAPVPPTSLSPTEHSLISSLGSIVPYTLLEDRMYRKLALNACINPVTAIYNLPNRCVAEDTPSHALSKQLATEVQRVYAAARPEMDMSSLVEDVIRLARDTGKNISSMLADVRARRDTEIDFINGHIVKMGKTAGVDVTRNEDIVRRVKCISSRS
jgi:2-dehydropantoate 2-reductase